MAPPKQRMRAFGPKSRSGCDLCKHRRVKCDELRPSCGNCRKRGMRCAYTAPKIWIFEPKKQRDTDEAAPVQHFDTLDLLGLGICDWPADERYLMRYYIRRTGPYLSQYTYLEAKKSWTVMIPRLANSLPALRHLVLALAMMDSRLHQVTSQALVVRSESVILHYNKAIRLLTRDSASIVEVIASAILSHILETMIRNANAAQIHLQAAQKLLAKVGESVKRSGASEAEELLANDLRAMYISAAGYHSTEPTFRPTQDNSATSVLNSVKALHSPQGLRSVKEVLFVYERLFERMNSNDPLARPNVEQLKEFTSLWELAILQLSHDCPEPPVNFFAAHMLVCVANTLVPRLSSSGLTEEQFDLQFPANATAISYILRKLHLLLEEDTKQLGKADLVIFNRILRVASNTIYRFAMKKSQRNEAQIILTKIETAEGTAVRTKSAGSEPGRSSTFADSAISLSDSKVQQQMVVLSEFAARKLRIIEPLSVPDSSDLPLRDMT